MLNMEEQLLMSPTQSPLRRPPKRNRRNFMIFVYFVIAMSIFSFVAVAGFLFLKAHFHLSHFHHWLYPGDLSGVYSRINCFPEFQGSSNNPWQISQEQCRNRNCTFDEDTSGVAEAPPCYMPPSIGFEVVAKPATAKIADVSPNVLKTLWLRPLSTTPIYDPPISLVRFTVKILKNNHLQIKIEDAKKARYQVPFSSPMTVDIDADASATSFDFNYTTKPFAFWIVRKTNGAVLFNSSMGGFVFSDRFLQLTTRLPSKQFYGLGEQEHPALLHNLYYKTHALFARDQPGLGEGYPLYGVHPFYMVLENDGNASGVFLLNSNAMEFSLLPAPGVVIRTIGGIFDLHIYTGPTPENVIQQHTEFVGRPFIPPYWGLGFQLSRYGYGNLEQVQIAINRTRQYSIPLDVIYSDIDHMDQRKDFTIDPTNFGNLPAYLRQEKQQNGLRSVIILDPGVTNNASDYYPWNVLSGNDTFIKWSNKSVMLGYVWPPGKVGFPDFFLDRTEKTWADLIKRHSAVFPFDGLWTDMNEPSNFGTNDIQPFNWPKNLPPWSLKCQTSYYEDPPYRTDGVSIYDSNTKKARLSDKTLCMEAVTNDGKYRMYDTHSFYGYLESRGTSKALQQAYPGRRGFILSRSTFAGSGTFSAHWLGDNVAKWDHLQHSIITMLEMSFFGIAQTGPDICGFIGTPTPDLCKRWMQAGAFYPYSRNHNSMGYPPQDPGYFGPDVAVPAKEYMDLRYQILPYMYTLFYQAHVNGTTVARPLFFEFPTDKVTWNIDRQFMLGKSFLVAPILDAAKSDVVAYLPQGYWYQWTKGSASFYDNCDSEGKYTTIDVDGPALFQRGGSIIASQGINNDSVVSTQTTRKQPFNLTIVPDCDFKEATGWLFWDDGDSIETVESGHFLLVSYKLTTNANEIILNGNLDHTSNDATLGADLSYSTMKFVKMTSQPKLVSLTCSGSAEQCPQVTTTYNAASAIFEVNLLANGDKKLTITQFFLLTLTMP